MILLILASLLASPFASLVVLGLSFESFFSHEGYDEVSHVNEVNEDGDQEEHWADKSAAFSFSVLSMVVSLAVMVLAVMALTFNMV